MSEAVDRYIGLADAFAARVEAAPDDKLDAQSPCEDWKARDVIAHVVGTMRGVAAGLTGGEPEPLAADADIKEAFRSSYAALKDALGRADLSTPIPGGPMGPMPAEMLVGRILASDVLVHTWDLARAVGGDEQLDQDAVGHAYEGLKPMDAMIRRPGVFGPRIDAPEGADLQTEFLSFLGRKV